MSVVTPAAGAAHVSKTSIDQTVDQLLEAARAGFLGHHEWLAVDTARPEQYMLDRHEEWAYVEPQLLAAAHMLRNAPDFRGEKHSAFLISWMQEEAPPITQKKVTQALLVAIRDHREGRLRCTWCAMGVSDEQMRFIPTNLVYEKLRHSTSPLYVKRAQRH